MQRSALALCEVLDLNHSPGSLPLGVRRSPDALSPVPLVRACPGRPRAGIREVKGYKPPFALLGYGRQPRIHAIPCGCRLV